jgi:hypothetical protein
MTSPTTLKGNIGQAAVYLQALKKGYGVSVPNEGMPYDLIIDRYNVLSRVQVKYIAPTNGSFTIKFDIASGAPRLYSRYTSENCDAIIAFNPETEDCYWIDSKHFKTEKHGSLCLRLTPSKNNQTKNVNWAKDFLEW